MKIPVREHHPESTLPSPFDRLKQEFSMTTERAFTDDEMPKVKEILSELGYNALSAQQFVSAYQRIFKL